MTGFATDYQHAEIQKVVDEAGGAETMRKSIEMLEEGAAVSDLPFWKPPKDFKMAIPSRARALLWGREARRQAFETEAGRELMATAYYDDGLMADDDGKYLLMTERDQLHNDSVKSQKATRKEKTQARIEKQKAGKDEWKDALGRMMLSTGASVHGERSIPPE